jgi:hypothetical protein
MQGGGDIRRSFQKIPAGVELCGDLVGFWHRSTIDPKKRFSLLAPWPCAKNLRIGVFIQ